MWLKNCFAIALISAIIFDVCHGLHDIPACMQFGSKLPIVVSIPPEASSCVAYGLFFNNSLQFNLRSGLGLKCTNRQWQLRQLIWNLTYRQPNATAPRNFRDAESGTSYPHAQSYFTAAGYFYDNVSTTYYSPNNGDYCVSEYSEYGITLNVCVNIAGQNIVWSVPKCCALDEVLLYWEHKCVSTPETQGVTPWVPPIYAGLDLPNRRIPRPEVLLRIRFQFAKLPEGCQQVVKTDQSSRVFFRHLVASSVTHPNRSFTQRKENLRVVPPFAGTSESVIPIGWSPQNKKWEVSTDISGYCVDGFLSGGKKPYKGNDNDWIFIYCLKETSNKNITFHKVCIAWVNIVISGIDVLFLLASIVVHLMLLEKQSFRGFAFLSYLVATLSTFAFVGMANLIGLYPKTLGKFVGLYRHGFACFSISVLAHYFIITSYLWLTVVNFDMWKSLRSNTVVVAQTAKAEWKKKFIKSSLVAWMLPATLIIAFVAVNEIYRTSDIKMLIPDYAVETCFVSRRSRGIYLYLPIAGLLVTNLLLLAMTFQIILKARKVAVNVLQASSGMSNKYSVVLFIKIFILMGGAYVVEFLIWYYNDEDISKPWTIVVLECISAMTPVGLFGILFKRMQEVRRLRKTQHRPA